MNLSLYNLLLTAISLQLSLHDDEVGKKCITTETKAIISWHITEPKEDKNFRKGVLCLKCKCHLFLLSLEPLPSTINTKP